MLYPLQYPLTLSFKIVALAPQIYVRDASGREILYVKQKLLKLKEKVRVFADSSQSQQLYEINADRWLDWSARYAFTDPQGRTVGSVRRHGARSLWRATYEVAGETGNEIFRIEEENPWVKVLDGLLGGIPILGIFAGYFLIPATASSTPVRVSRPCASPSTARSWRAGSRSRTSAGLPANPRRWPPCWRS